MDFKISVTHVNFPDPDGPNIIKIGFGISLIYFFIA